MSNALFHELHQHSAIRVVDCGSLFGCNSMKTKVLVKSRDKYKRWQWLR